MFGSNADARGTIIAISFHYFRPAEGIFTGVKPGTLPGITTWCSCVQSRTPYCSPGYGIFVCEKNSKLIEKYFWMCPVCLTSLLLLGLRIHYPLLQRRCIRSIHCSTTIEITYKDYCKRMGILVNSNFSFISWITYYKDMTSHPPLSTKRWSHVRPLIECDDRQRLRIVFQTWRKYAYSYFIYLLYEVFTVSFTKKHAPYLCNEICV